jgi:hypothetical protein
MVAVLLIVAILIVVAAGAGVLSRRRAAERARVERERELIAGELSGQERQGRFQRDTDAAERHDKLSHHR